MLYNRETAYINSFHRSYFSNQKNCFQNLHKCKTFQNLAIQWKTFGLKQNFPTICTSETYNQNIQNLCKSSHAANLATIIKSKKKKTTTLLKANKKRNKRKPAHEAAG